MSRKIAQDRAERIIRLARQHQPELKDARKLTDDIMASLKDTPVSSNITGKDRNILFSINFRRMLAAAAIILLGVLGYEQYLVLDKINRLEIQLEKVAREQGPVNKSLFISSWETKTMMNFRKIKDNNRSLAEKVRDVRDMMKTIDKNSSAKADNYRMRAINKYNSMIMR